MPLIKYLANLGYGSRRGVAALIAAQRVRLSDGTVLCDDDPFTHAALRIDGAPADPPPGTVLVLNKPIGYVCSTRDVPPLVYELLPRRFLKRRPVMATVGRLDRDTSGLLLLTDDGALNHRLTSPRSTLPKTYRATLAEDITSAVVERFASGTMILEGERTPLLPATATVLDPRVIELTITEGRYHQVRRMLAATGNHVARLQRVAIGRLALGEIAEGTWRELSAAERLRLTSPH